MNRNLIQDNPFQGSPLLSYGRASRRGFWILSILVGLGFLILACFFYSLWFWHSSRIPLPDKTVAYAVLPTSASLPSVFPSNWQQMQSENDPFPTIVGYAWHPQAQRLIPFAMRQQWVGGFFHIRDGFWHITSDFPLSRGDVLKPSTIFGSFFTFPSFKEPQLSLFPRQLFAPFIEDSSLYPPVLSGSLSKGQWAVLLEDGLKLPQIEYPSLAHSEQEGILIDPMTAYPLERQLLAFGVPVNFLENSLLSWGSSTASEPFYVAGTSTSPQMILDPPNSSVELTLLPDGTNAFYLYVSSSTLPASSFDFSMEEVLYATSTPVFQSASSISCPGEPLTFLKARRLDAFFSWFGIPSFLSELKIHSDGKRVFFCYS